MMTTSALASFLPEKSDSLKVVDVPPKMTLELAMGVEEPADIAARYGYYGKQWELLQQHEPFLRAVEDKKREMQATGYTFKTRAHLMATDLLEDVFVDAKKPETNSHTRLEALKFLAKAGGVDTPPQEQTTAGSGVSIIINIQGDDGNDKSIELHSGRTIEHDEVPDYLKGAPFTLKIEANDE